MRVLAGAARGRQRISRLIPGKRHATLGGEKARGPSWENSSIISQLHRPSIRLCSASLNTLPRWELQTVLQEIGKILRHLPARSCKYRIVLAAAAAVGMVPGSCVCRAGFLSFLAPFHLHKGERRGEKKKSLLYFCRVSGNGWCSKRARSGQKRTCGMDLYACEGWGKHSRGCAGHRHHRYITEAITALCCSETGNTEHDTANSGTSRWLSTAC